MKLFLSCDWGTSAFRLRLVAAEKMEVMAEIETGQGIAATFDNCTKAGQQFERAAFYQAYLLEQVNKMKTACVVSLVDTPIVLSGMASSSIGMLELPYKQLPFQCTGADLILHNLNSGEYPITIISGAASETDVIRGEETMLAGCDFAAEGAEQLLIFPGTHSKHIQVKDGMANKITTYMTGELFDLLSSKSTLSASVEKNPAGGPEAAYHFGEGVKKGAALNLLNSIFQVRTNGLFKKASPTENYHFLSGLLIGYELKGLALNPPPALTLVCNEELKSAYLQALGVLSLAQGLEYKNAAEALVTGQWNILQHQGYLV